MPLFSQTDIDVIAKNYKFRLEKALDFFHQNKQTFDLRMEQRKAFDDARSQYSNTRNLNSEQRLELFKLIKESAKKIAESEKIKTEIPQENKKYSHIINATEKRQPTEPSEEEMVEIERKLIATKGEVAEQTRKIEGDKQFNLPFGNLR